MQLRDVTQEQFALLGCPRKRGRVSVSLNRVSEMPVESLYPGEHLPISILLGLVQVSRRNLVDRGPRARQVAFTQAGLCLIQVTLHAPADVAWPRERRFARPLRSNERRERKQQHPNDATHDSPRNRRDAARMLRRLREVQGKGRTRATTRQHT